MMTYNGHPLNSERERTTLAAQSDVQEFSPFTSVTENGHLASNAKYLSDGDVTEVKQVAQTAPHNGTADHGPPDPEDIWRAMAAARLAAQPNLRPLPPGKKYHAYFCCAEEDLDWVRRTVQILEKEHGFRCCFSERDFKRGATIVHSSNYAIEQSGKVVFVVTTSSLRDAWCSFEAEVVTHWGVDSKERLLVLVVLEKTELPPSLRSLTKINATDPTFIDKIITDISEDGLSQIEAMDLLGGRPPAKTSCPDAGFSLDGLETELDGIQKIMESLDQSEIKAIAKIAFGHGAITDLPELSVFLFRRLKDSQKLQSHDVIYLQTLLWKVRRTDLFQKVADEAKRLYRNIGHKMCHLDFPHLKPVPGFNPLKFHVAVDMESLSAQRLEQLKADVIKAVDIPKESQEYVRVVGIEQGSVWVTIILPQEYADLLRKNFWRAGTQVTLALAQVTGVKFSPSEEEMFLQQKCAETEISKTDNLPNTPEESEESDALEQEKEIGGTLSRDAKETETLEEASMSKTSPEGMEETSVSVQPEADHSEPEVNWEAELRTARSPGWSPPPLPQGKYFHVIVFCSEKDVRWGRHLEISLIDKFDFRCYDFSRDAPVGCPIVDVVIEGLERSCTAVFLVSPACREDHWYRFAVKVAKAMASRGVELKIIPVMVKKCKLPKAFQTFSCIDATIPNFLCKVIKSISKSINLKKCASSQVCWSIDYTTARQKKAEERENVGGEGKDASWYRRFINRLRAWLPFSQGASMSKTSLEGMEETSTSAQPEADHSEPGVSWEAELRTARSPGWSPPPLPQGKDFHVYISCCNEDMEWAMRLVKILEEEFGLQCCVPFRDALIGAEKWNWIWEAIMRSCTVAAIVSCFTLQHAPEEFEVAFSVSRGESKVIPVMVERCTLPKALWLFPYIDATVPCFLRMLIDAVSSDDDDEDEFA